MGLEFKDPLGHLVEIVFEYLKKPEIIGLIVLIIFAYLAFIVIKNLFRGIISLIKTLLHFLSQLFSIGTRTRTPEDPLQSSDWLTRAQAKQEIRFQNASPPLLPKKQPQKKKWRPFQKKGLGETWYPTGWILNEETGKWEPPDYLMSKEQTVDKKTQGKEDDTTYHYTRDNIPKENSKPEPQTHFHHDDTTFRVKQEPYTRPQETGYHLTKENLPKDETIIKPKETPEAPPKAKQEAQPKAAAYPRIIYTYARPELKAEDRDYILSEEMDFRNSYQRRELFTRNEWQNYKKLREIAEVRGFVVCPKVRLFDLIEPRHDKKKKLTYRYKIQAKHVDFVICDRDMNIKAILELDDGSHYDPERIKRDEFVNTILLSTGYTVIHTKYIDSSIFDLI